MLKKLIKYDFKAVFKYWWIAALSVLVLCVSAAFAFESLLYKKNTSDSEQAFLIVLVCFAFFAIIAFSIINFILLFKRFKNNLFSDEGYLTFTLPVKRSSILTSKLITNVVFDVMTVIVILLGVFVMVTLASEYEIFNIISMFFSELWQLLGMYLVIYAICILALLLLITVFSVLVLFICITCAYTITKKSRVLVGIGIYYGINFVISSFSNMFLNSSFEHLSKWLFVLPESSSKAAIVLILLAAIAFVALLCMLVYTIEYYILDRKLNLE